MTAGAISERDSTGRSARPKSAACSATTRTPPDFFKAIRGDDPNRAVRDCARACTIAAARAAGLRVGIVSNELELFWGRSFMDRLDLLREIDVLVDATRNTGVLKPDPRAYRAALEALGGARGARAVRRRPAAQRRGRARSRPGCDLLRPRRPRRYFRARVRALFGSASTDLLPENPC
ncbi:MAG: hypothetical protein U1F11_15685 [Steroidobacteraceae bacterium]